MPVYEFACSKGHVVEDVVPMGTKTIPCAVCLAEAGALRSGLKGPTLATRILSATRTDFVFADTMRGKRR